MFHFDGAGQVITYTFLVVNGPVTATQISVTDSDIGPISCPATSLAPNASMECVAQYTTTSADVTAGAASNSATLTLTEVTGTRIVRQESVTIPYSGLVPSLIVGKTGASFFTRPGEVLPYTYQVVNGPLGVVGITVVDDQIGAVSCPSSILTPGGRMTCTAQYTVTEADVLAGVIVNTATVTGTSTTGQPVSQRASASVPFGNNNWLSLTKQATPSQFSGPGEVLTYTYRLISAVTGLTNVSLVDSKIGPVPCPSTEMPRLQPLVCTAQYTTTQADVVAGGVANTVFAMGERAEGAIITRRTTAAVPYTGSAPALRLSKIPSPTTFTSPGQVITYGYRITNGAVEVSGVSLVDDRLGAVACPATSLPPGGTMDCLAQYTATEGDITAGSIQNTATVTANPPAGPPVTATAGTEVVAMPAAGAIALEKVGLSETFTAAGETITYVYRVRNPSQVLLSGVSLVDDRLGAITCPFTTLVPGATMVCTAQYTTTAADVAAGSIVNTAAATATPPTGVTVRSLSQARVSFEDIAGAISLVKAATPATFAAPGQTITYVYRVTNPSRLALSGIRLVDDRLGAITCPSTTLAPGATMACPAQYTTTAADVLIGSVWNTAAVTAVPAVGAPVASAAKAYVIFRPASLL
ncbi:hypothetical protein AB1460_15135 [Parafrankia sp. FMc2]